MPTRAARSVAATFVLAVGLAACGQSGSESPTSPVTASTDAATAMLISTDVARDAGDASASLNETFGASESASGAAIALAPSAGLSFTLAAAAPSTACTGPDATGFYTCVRTQENDFTVARSYRFWSGGSIALRYAEATTDSVNHRWTLTGSHVVTDTANGGTTRTGTANRSDTATVRIVRGASPQHVWASVGVRIDTSTVVDRNGTRRYVVAASDTAASVAYAQPRSANPWPVSGTVTHNLRTTWTGAQGATTTTTRRAVVTFNGTQTASIQVGGLTCSLDLRTHRTAGCH